MKEYFYEKAVFIHSFFERINFFIKKEDKIVFILLFTSRSFIIQDSLADIYKKKILCSTTAINNNNNKKIFHA